MRISPQSIIKASVLTLKITFSLLYSKSLGTTDIPYRWAMLIPWLCRKVGSQALLEKPMKATLLSPTKGTLTFGSYADNFRVSQILKNSRASRTLS